MMSEEARLFLRKFMSRPKQIGSIVPSSVFLAQCMVEAVPWTSVGAVAELGSGTGAVTREIAKRVRPDTQVYLFEMDSRMRSRLADKYPRFTRAANAANLLRVMERNGTQQLDCIVSCLPFFNFPASLRDELMRQVIEALKPGGVLAVWSSGPDHGFTRRLRDAGFAAEEISVRASRSRRGARHVIWLATRR